MTRQRDDAAQGWLDALFAAQPMPALSVAIAGPDGVLWQGAKGLVDLDHQVPAKPGSCFRLASVSKPITAMLAARLASRGVIALDTPIGYWLPDLPQQHRATTLTQLLTHRAGVRHYLPKDLDPAQPYGSIHNRAGWTREQVLAVFIDDALVAPPGTTVGYSSFGYTLASLVIEAAAAAPFLQLVAEEIAAPFTLPSLRADRGEQVIPGRARGYVSAGERRFLRRQFPHASWPEPFDGWGAAMPVNPGYSWAGAGMIATMPDIARFGAAHLDSPASLISAAERALLFTPLTERTEQMPPLGLGWRVDHDPTGRLRWHHSGGMPGACTMLVIYPAAQLAIAFASNCTTAPTNGLGHCATLADLFA
ncbi:MAG: serine hydrolase domain-containing protein [Alteraurantiacibacter sp.]